MRLLYLTAGAANMYCGSCLRDNALATELMARGHDVLLVPVYTPTLTDEPNVSQEKVFFGGISVYLQQHSALFRRSPWLLDKLWDSAAALRLASRRSLPVDPRWLGELTISMLKGESGHQGKELWKMLHWMREQATPDLVSLPNSLLISMARPIKGALNRPVCCTLQGEDLFLNGLNAAHREQSLRLIRAQVEHVDCFIAVSDYYARFMCDFLGIPERKMRVVPLGINLDGYDDAEAATVKRAPAGAAENGDTFTVGYFARVAPEKGLHLLCEAYRRLRARGDIPAARLEVAGYLAPEHQTYLRGLEQQMSEWGFAGEFHYRGVLDRRQKIEFLHGLDVFSVPATYDEPKGISLLEALACGTPVVEPRRGALTEIVERTGGGLLVEPDDAESLAEGLHTIWREPERARDLGRQGAAAVRARYSVAHMADRALEVYEEVVSNQ
ncbi:MAG: glycosyltransferase family 4 protein [Pyrinomonadaceae bacterium]|nr:glycosyltransferase family 4 protein [Pyrinomonadaceae bacterium]